VVCILLAPVLGLVAADKSTNPPGEGPGVLQVILGVGIPAGVAFVVARHVGNRTRARALAWSVASVAATGVILVLLWIYVFTVVRPA